MLNKIWTAILVILLAASSQAFAQTQAFETIPVENSETELTVENGENEELTFTNEELENMLTEREMLLELEAHRERQRAIARRLSVRFGLGVGLTQALAIKIGSPNLDNPTLDWTIVVGGAVTGMLVARALTGEGTVGQIRAARTFHRVSTILAAELFWIEETLSCQGDEYCDGHPEAFGVVLSLSSLASVVAGISFAKNHPNLREEEALRYQHAMYWGLVGGTLLSMPTYDEANDNGVGASSMTFIWSVAGLTLGSYLNKMDLLTAHEVVIMSQIGILGVFAGLSLAGITNGDDILISSIYGTIGGGLGMALGYSLVHDNPNTSFGRRFNSLAIAPNTFEHGEGHRVSGLAISGSF